MAQETEQKDKEKKSIGKNPIVWVIALLLIGGVGYWAVTSGAIDMNRFGISGVPEEFVAKVNGEGIQKRLFDARFEQLKGNSEAQGTLLREEEITQLREQILADMVNERLLIQYAREQGIVVDEQLVEREYQLILSQFESEEDLESQLVDNNTTVQELRGSIGEQLTIRELANQQVTQNNVEVSQEEIQQAYDDAVASGAEVPPLEEVQEQIKDFISQQKVAQLMGALLERLRSEGSVEILS